MSNDRALPKTSPWTTDDVRNAASNWSLEGDKALLGILQNIHEGLHRRTEDVINKIDELNSELGNTSLSLKNVNNRFIGLSSTQFVECTVQEDDVEIIKRETDSDTKLVIENQASTQQKDKDSLENEKREKKLDCVSKSLQHLEGLCERLDISPDSESDSDSQPEDIIQRTVLKPKDLYFDDPLPHIIGSQDWKKKWHIGLHECSSGSESENEDNRESRKKKKKDSYSSYEELYDDNDARTGAAERKGQMTLPIPGMARNQPSRLSTASTPTNYSTDTEDSEVAKINADMKPDVHSTPKQKDSASTGSEKQVPKPKVNASDFAAELAKKLGGGSLVSNPINTDKSQDVANSNNKQVINTSKSEGRSKAQIKQSDSGRGLFDSEKEAEGNIFFDEPPPLDTESIQGDKNDLFGSDDDDNDSISSGLFSKKPSKPNPRGTGLFGNIPTSGYGGLFNDIPDDDDDEVIVKPKQPAKKSQAVVSKGLFDDDSDDEFFTNKVKPKPVPKKNVEVKKPIQAPNIKSNSEKASGLFDDDLDSSVEVKSENINKKVTSAPKTVSKGLFDDSDDESDLFSGNISFANKNDTSKPQRVSNTKSSTEGKKDEVKKRISLFDDTSDDDGDLFSSLKPAAKSIPTKPVEKKATTKTEKDLPKSEPNIIEKKKEVLEEDLFSVLRMPEKKTNVQITNTFDKKPPEAIESKPSQNSPEKNETGSKKPVGAVSVFGENVNILKGPNSIAASILARKRKDSSSDESTADDDSDENKKQDFINPKTQTETVQEKSSEPVKDEIEKSKIPNTEVQKKLSSIPNVSKPIIKPQKPEPTKQMKTPDNEIVQSKSKQPVVQNKSVIDIRSKAETVKSSSSNIPQPAKPEQTKPVEKEIKGLFEGSDDLFSKGARTEDLFEDSEPLELPPPLETVKQVVKEPKNANSLFDDDDDDDLFSSLKGTKSNKSDSNLFDEVPNEDIFSKKSSNRNVHLFSDEPPDIDYIPDDSEQSEQEYPTNISTYIKNDRDTKQNDIEVPSDYNETTSNQTNFDIPPPLDDISSTKKTNSLFGEMSDDDDDLFSSLLKKKTNIAESTKPATDIKSGANILPAITKPTISQSKPKLPTKPDKSTDIIASQLPKSEKDSVAPEVAVKESPKKSIVDMIASLDTEAENYETKTVNVREPEIVTTNIKTNVNIKEMIGNLENKEIEEVKNNIKEEPIINKLKHDIVNTQLQKSNTEEEIDGGALSSLTSDQVNKDKPQESPTRSIGKLKTNLNINVKALMPGSAPVLKKKTDVEPQKPETHSVSEEPTSFDSQPSSLDSVLANSWSKDKLNVQVKRRPQSRRARQEAVRKSAADMLYSFDSTDSSHNSYISSLPNSPTQEDASESYSSLNPEIISSLENSTSEPFESSIQTIGKVYGSEQTNNVPQSKIAQVPNEPIFQSHGDILNIRSTKPSDTDKKNSTRKFDKQVEIAKDSKIKKEDVPTIKESKPINKDAHKPKPLFDDLGDDIFNTPKPGKQKSLFGDDDDDDVDNLFAKVKETSIPKVKTQKQEPLKPEHGAIKKETSKKVNSKSIFSDSDSDSDLFSTKPKKTESVKKVKTPSVESKAVSNKKQSLFGDSDTEDDLFTNIPKKSLEINKQPPHKSLFGDDDDDDEKIDIFKTTSRIPQQTSSTSHNISKTKQSSTTIQKTASQVTTIDPLSSFLNDP